MGQYRYGEPFKSEPIIVLATYQKLDKDMDIVIDNSQNMNELSKIETMVLYPNKKCVRQIYVLIV